MRRPVRGEKLINFIDSLGLQKKTGEKVWKHGGYSFTYEEVGRFIKILNESGTLIKNRKNIYFLLYYYIEKKQDRYMRETIAHKSNAFSNLSGTDFEALLYRLYVAMDSGSASIFPQISKFLNSSWR